MGYYASIRQELQRLASQEGYPLCTTPLNFGIYDKDNVLPYTMNYTLNVQWQPTNTVAVSARLHGKSRPSFGDSDSYQ